MRRWRGGRRLFQADGLTSKQKKKDIPNKMERHSDIKGLKKYDRQTQKGKDTI